MFKAGIGPSTLVLVLNTITYISTLVLILKYNKYTHKYIGTCTWVELVLKYNKYIYKYIGTCT